MIVEMSRVVVLGPKRLLGQVIEEVQRLGSVHVDHIESEEVPPSLTRAQLSDEESRRQQAAERALARCDGLLALLPATGPAAPDAGESAQTTEELDARIAEVERRIRELTRARLELEEEQSLIASYEGAVRALAPLLSALRGSRALDSIGALLNTKDLTVVAALRKELAKATEGRVEVVSRIVEDSRIGVVVAYRKQDADVIRPVLSRSGVTELRLPARFQQAQPADTVALMERRKAELPGEIERIDAEVAAVARAERGWIASARAVLADRLSQMKVVPDLRESRYTFILHGWTPSRELAHLRARLRQRFGGETVVYDEPADPHREPERVPVLLSNRPFVRPFQMLLSLFQPPRYGAWDPSPVMAVTFPIFVGLVIGDAGYGLLLFLAGWWLRNKARMGRPLEIRFLSLAFPPGVLADLSFVLRVLAGWVIFFGAIYAEVFGNLPELLFRVQPLYNRVHQADNYFQLVIAAGILMIFFGLAVHLALAIRHRHPVGVFESVVIMLGTAGLLLFLGAQGAMLPGPLGPVGLYLLLGAVLVAALSLTVDRSIMKQFLWILESATGFGHILSHARLMAFGLAAAVLATAANELGIDMSRMFHVSGLVGNAVAFLIAALWQTLFLIFTIIGHMVQPARLHWVELLTKFKFHEETGRRYQPFHRSAAGGR